MGLGNGSTRTNAILEINTQYNVMTDCHLHNDGTLNTISKGPAFTATMYNMYIDKTKKQQPKKRTLCMHLDELDDGIGTKVKL